MGYVQNKAGDSSVINSSPFSSSVTSATRPDSHLTLTPKEVGKNTVFSVSFILGWLAAQNCTYSCALGLLLAHLANR